MEQNLLEIFELQKLYAKGGQMKRYRKRIETLEQLELMLKKIEPELLAALREDLGKHPQESYASELGLVYRSITSSKRNLAGWMRKQYVCSPVHLFPSVSYKKAKPLGTVLIMSSFNYPVLLSLDPLVGALAAGNTAMLALSSQTPHVNEVLMRGFQGFLPRDIVHTFVGGRAVNQEILKFPFDKIFFTGSKEVGKVVMEAASHNLTPVTLELGGKSPAVVLEDANIKMAAKRIVWGKFLNSGQTCVAPDYVLVHESKVVEFITFANAYLQKMYGDTRRSEDYSRLINDKALDRLIDILESDKDYIVAGGEYSRENKFIEPTILLAQKNDDLAAMQDEIFGPILPVISFTSLNDAYEVVSRYPKPLAFYPFTKSRRDLERMLFHVDFGGATVNGTVLHMTNEKLPFGGVGGSGMGSYHGKYSFEAFSHYEAIVERMSPMDFPVMRAPYREWKDILVRSVLK